MKVKLHLAALDPEEHFIFVTLVMNELKQSFPNDGIQSEGGGGGTSDSGTRTFCSKRSLNKIFQDLLTFLLAHDKTNFFRKDLSFSLYTS